MLRRTLASVFAVLVVVGSLAQVAYAETVEEEARHIGKQLQCPVCNGAPVSDSPSELAGQMRSVIRAKLQAGETEQQIVQYFVERYGDGVLIEPPRRGFTMIVWLGPVVVLAIGGLVLWRLLSGWLRPRWSTASLAPSAPATAQLTPYRNGTVSADATTVPPSPVDRARAELDRFRREA